MGMLFLQVFALYVTLSLGAIVTVAFVPRHFGRARALRPVRATPRISN